MTTLHNSRVDAAPRVSVIIKALNEETKIARAIESALEALARVDGGGEVILADSLSADATVAIAARYPVRILQLSDPRDRSCGVGAQLGMSAVGGAFVYILDGDMELDAGFLPLAIARMDADSRLAGVAGLVVEMHAVNQAFRRRQLRSETSRPASDVLCLNMGGLYRREAIDALGYLTNRNLHAYEEFELGVRLVTAGWRLERIGVTAVRHYGHTDNSYSLLRKRWRSRYAWGHGELLRQSWRYPHRALVLQSLSAFRVVLFVAVSWLMLVVACWSLGWAWPLSAMVVVAYWAMLVLVLAWRKRSVSAAAYGLVAWHVAAAGLVRGLLATPRADPRADVPHRVLQ
jgi:glycosyltransferase involved in cell wall biosynthesis